MSSEERRYDSRPVLLFNEMSEVDTFITACQRSRVIATIRVNCSGRLVFSESFDCAGQYASCFRGLAFVPRAMSIEVSSSKAKHIYVGHPTILLSSRFSDSFLTGTCKYCHMKAWPFTMYGSVVGEDIPLGRLSHKDLDRPWS